ncbi:hypothetical protein [Enterococcus sp. RIT-PI-f]|uniref:hypothetical protein n=1 Tax=Enterococcus sp. RIT-PI-f TaxID=1690244 RepID=UPI0006B8F899|nr:hypothetical protein [Enterococcus sp. RIT-PI-f]KPG73285.1 hypothetical protein AEQ18_01345 [Enterococcus sp. RIT-PI-f]
MNKRNRVLIKVIALLVWLIAIGIALVEKGSARKKPRQLANNRISRLMDEDGQEFTVKRNRSVDQG